MADIDRVPDLNNKKTGKYTEESIKNLPQLPDKRVKPLFDDTKNSVKFLSNIKDNPVGQNSIDLIKQINAS